MILKPEDYPKSVQFDFEKGEFAPRSSAVERKLSDLKMMFADQDAIEKGISSGDPTIYDIFYYGFVTTSSDMALGTTRIYPGTIGDEFYMTKGHFHEAEDQPEIYFCVKGTGYLLLETKNGEFQAEKWTKGTISHIPPMWAHRVVNTGDGPLVFVATYHLAAGHDYEPIVNKGFSKRLVKKDGVPVLIENQNRL